MNRLDEFQKNIKIDGTASESDKIPFYLSLYNEVLHLERQCRDLNSFKRSVLLKNELLKTKRSVESVFSGVRIKGSADAQRFYDGIKLIVALKVQELDFRIEKAKDKFSVTNIELLPERDRGDRSETADSQLFVSEQVLKQKNQGIVESYVYEATIQRLQKIETIQKAINVQLNLQNERIDNIVETTAVTGTIYEKLAEGEDFGAGSLLKRMLTIILVCLSFVLLFLHFSHR